MGTFGFFVRCEQMSERAEACRKKVTECQRLARPASEPAIGKAYLDLVQQWREIAEQAEQIAAMQSRSS